MKVKTSLKNWGIVVGLGLSLMACSDENLSLKVYNQGLNLLPIPTEVTPQKGQFELTKKTVFCANSPEAKSIAEFYTEKIQQSTGFTPRIVDAPVDGSIELKLNASVSNNPEGYRIEVTPGKVNIEAPTPQGLFYGMSTFMQLLPAEIESSEAVRRVKWTAPAIKIDDAPRFHYRGLMIDVARHFTSVEGLKRHIDMLATLKINHLHLHLTDFQGWRIEIKKYPKLTTIGSKRIDEYGKPYSGFFTQEEMKDIVNYAKERFITIIPEIDVPGHSLAAIASYPELSCTGEQYDVLNRWGPFPVVLCPGKEDMFEFLDNVFAELSTIFPSEYFHIGGDECPKEVWKTCSNCQHRIRKEGLKADKEHSAEQRLQSYAISRCEKLLKKYGKKMIGWDEILQGGLAPDATVMSWRGEKGGIASALMDHQVIMTPTSGGMYLDHYQGDPLAESFSWGAYAPIARTYSYDPVPDTLIAMGKEQYILGVQGNLWSECLPTEQAVEYQIYPRIMAVAETGWSKKEDKNFEDFSRRLNNMAVRMDGHHINYHIPMPEQPGGSFNHLAFTTSETVEFTSTRPVKMVYTLDGSEPDQHSTEYTKPLEFTSSATIKIRSVLPSGKMSAVRTIEVEQQQPTASEDISGKKLKDGLNLKIANARCLYTKELKQIKQWKDSTLTELNKIAHLRPNPYRNVDFHVAIAEGWVECPADGVYQFKSDNTRIWIGNHLVVDNDGRPQLNSKYGRSMVLQKGWHKIKVEQISNSIGGWNSQQRNSGNVYFKRTGQSKWEVISPDMLKREEK